MRLLRLIHVWWLELTADQDMAELWDRTLDGSASDAWTVLAMTDINRRRDKADSLRLAR